MIAMNADTKNNSLSLVVGAQQLDLERTRMLLEDQRMQIIEKTAGIREKVFFIRGILYPSRNQSETNRMMYEDACDALNLLDPEHPQSDSSI